MSLIKAPLFCPLHSFIPTSFYHFVLSLSYATAFLLNTIPIRGFEMISRVSDQNGVSPLYIMLEIHHSGRDEIHHSSREPSIYDQKGEKVGGHIT